MNNYSLRGCLKWPVTDEDKWCKRPRDSHGNIPKRDAPWGYVVIISTPMIDIDLQSVNGYIVRAKKHYGFLLLQVVNVGKKKYPMYRISIREDSYCKNMNSSIINVRNLNKSPKRKKRWSILI